MEEVWSGDDCKERFDDLYEIEATIGEGALWTVHQCRARWSQNLYAVKIYDKQAKKKRQKCIDIGSLVIIKHANLIKVKELFETASQLQLVVNLASGRELFQRLANHESYSENEIANCIVQLLGAIRCLHQHDVTHGNLKPENVLCQEDGERLTVLVGDYGMDRIIDYRTILLHNVWCSPGFIAPEILKGNRLDKLADIWSIGVIAYILLCGYEPFHSDIEAEKFKLIIKCQFDYDSAEWDEVSEFAKDFIRCLLVARPTWRTSATEALSHCWLKGAAAKHHQLQNAPHRLRQLVSGRKLKLSTEVARSFTSLDLAEMFPRQLASLEFLRDPIEPTDDETVTEAESTADTVFQATRPIASHPRDAERDEATGLVDSESRKDDDDTALLVEIPVDDLHFSIEYDHDGIPPVGLLFGDPVPWPLPTTDVIFLDPKDIRDSESVMKFGDNEHIPWLHMYSDLHAQLHSSVNLDELIYKV